MGVYFNKNGSNYKISLYFLNKLYIKFVLYLKMYIICHLK